MRFNHAEIKELSMKEGDQEGRLIHKPPPKTLYDSAYRERWFKLKGNLLFYYRLNEEGVVENNEPNGVFILENIKVEKEPEDPKYMYGFSLTWKDDLYRRHCFYTSTENVFHTWIAKILKASYEVLRAELLVLRLKIRQKTGNDPLEQFGTPLPVHSIRGILASPSKASSFFNDHGRESSSVHGRESSTTATNFIPATVNQQLPIRPVRDKRKNKIINSENVGTREESSSIGILNRSSSDAQIGKNEKEINLSSSFKSYLENSLDGKDITNKTSFKSHLYRPTSDNHIIGSKEKDRTSSASFKSHLSCGLSEDELNLFLK